MAVLMPAYNADRFINRAARSVADGTFPCDLFIIDDGSKHPVTEVLADDLDAHVLRLDKNSGIARARNAGMKEILRHPYEFVAILDADDVCAPDRIAKQVDFLDRHAGIAAVGAWGRHIDEDNGETIFVNRTPTNPDAVKKAMRSNLAIVHSSSMIRASVYRTLGLYSERYPVAEDYEFFRRLSARFAIANIPEILVDRGISRESISLRRRRRQLFDRFRIQLKYFEPGAFDAWLGLVKTFFLLLIPASLHSKFKSSGRTHVRGPRGLANAWTGAAGTGERRPAPETINRTTRARRAAI